MRKFLFITMFCTLSFILTVPVAGQNLYQQFDYVSVEGKVVTRAGNPVAECMVELRELASSGVSGHSGDAMSSGSNAVSAGWGSGDAGAVSSESRNVSNLKKVGWARTDSEGHYKMDGIPAPGDYVLIVKGQKGFKKTQMPLRIDSGKGKLFTIQDLVLDKYQDIDSKTRKLLKKSGILLKKGDMDGAEKLLLEANSRNADLSQIHVSLGNIYLKKKKYNNALSEFTKAFELGDRNSALCMTSAKIAFSMKKFSESADFADALLESKPEDLMGLYVAGISHFNLKQFKEAEPYFAKYAEIKGAENHDVNFFYVYGITENALGHYDKAAEFLNEAYRNGWKANPAFLEILAHAYLKQNKKDKAKFILKELLEKFPKFDGRKMAEETYNSL